MDTSETYRCHLRECLQDDEFALEYARCLKENDKEIRRCIYSKFKHLWRLRYGVFPWKKKE